LTGIVAVGFADEAPDKRPRKEGQNTPYVLLSVIGVMVETIVIMAAYSLVIVEYR